MPEPREIFDAEDSDFGGGARCRGRYRRGAEVNRDSVGLDWTSYPLMTMEPSSMGHPGDYELAYRHFSDSFSDEKPACLY